MPYRCWHPRIGLAATALLACVLTLSLSAAHAHLMVAQRGTINLQGHGAFMVLSLPASAFPSADDDGDGKLSQAELAAHLVHMESTIRKGVLLRDARGLRPLQGLLITRTRPDDAPQAPSDQIVVMGRFGLADPIEANEQALHFSITLFGRSAAEQAFQVKVTQGRQSQLLMLTPARAESAVLPPAWAVFTDYVDLGSRHILTGLDHLLFLLVVLAACDHWRQIVMALTCFSLGHTVTLVASLWGGFRVADTWVNPAIAVTIMGMALLDEYLRRQAVTPPVPARLALVFVCSLIHGLGLATSLVELALDDSHRWLSLAGFNVGIELGQLAVAVLAMGLYQAVKIMSGGRGQGLFLRMTSLTAAVTGGVWLMTQVGG